MKELLLVILIAAAIVFGFFLMKHLDAFLAANRDETKTNKSRNAQKLRIAFCNPSVADTIALPLEKLSRVHPNLELYLYSGTEDSIKQKLCEGELDLAFLPQCANCDDLPMCEKTELSLQQGELRSSRMELPIEPLNSGWITQSIAWRKNTCDVYPQELLMQIRNA